MCLFLMEATPIVQTSGQAKRRAHLRHCGIYIICIMRNVMHELTDGNTALHARDILAGVVDLAIQSLQKIIGSRQTDPIENIFAVCLRIPTAPYFGIRWWRTVIMAAAKLIGHCDASNSSIYGNNDELKAALAHQWLSDWVHLYSQDLRRVFASRGVWQSTKELRFLCVHMERHLWHHFIFPWIMEDGRVWVEVPDIERQ